MSLRDHLRRADSLIEPPWKRRPEILLCPQIPAPMAGMAPRVVLGKEWWDQTRKAAYRSTNYHCIACGVHKDKAEFHQWLEGHELYDTDYLLGRMTYIETVPLCHACHSFIHCGRLLVLKETGKISTHRYNRIIRHGRKVLKQAGLRMLRPYTGPCADWGDWRLVIDRKEYPPLYRSRAEWERVYGQHVDKDPDA